MRKQWGATSVNAFTWGWHASDGGVAVHGNPPLLRLALAQVPDEALLPVHEGVLLNLLGAERRPGVVRRHHPVPHGLLHPERLFFGPLENRRLGAG